MSSNKIMTLLTRSRQKNFTKYRFVRVNIFGKQFPEHRIRIVLYFLAAPHLKATNSRQVCGIQANIGCHCRNMNQAVAIPLHLQLQVPPNRSSAAQAHREFVHTNEKPQDTYDMCIDMQHAESYPGGQSCEMRTAVLRMYNRETIFSNNGEIPDCRDKEKKPMQVKPTQSPSLAQTNSSSSVKAEANAELDKPVDDSDYVNVPRVDEHEYANYSPQQTCVEQTLPKKKPVGTSLPGALKRKTASDWSDISTVGKITGDCKAIIGVTVLKQKVYVIHENSSQIQVYQSSTLNWLSEFKLVDLHEPKHLTSCAVNNCLYLAGLRDQTVYKAQSKGSKVLLKFKTDGDSHSISTTKGGNIILIGLLTQTLKEYTTHGTLLNTIILKPDVSMDINPWHAVKLESGNYLICHGKSRVGKHRVCMISPDGRVLKSFGDEKVSDMNGLFGPFHLALDEKGNILVADCNNQRIVILNPDLQYVTEIKTDLRHPVKLCFDSATGVLYVADNEFQDGRGETDK